MNKDIEEKKIWELINGILGFAHGASVSHTDAYCRAKEIIQSERKKTVEEFEEKIFFGETIQYEGKNYISTEHIQKVLEEYLKESEVI